jgi:ribonuclease Z
MLGDILLQTTKKSLTFRYEILKYYYSLFIATGGSGTVFRPVFLNFYNDDMEVLKDIVLDNGTVIPNNELTFDPIPVKSYAFCSDTKYDETIIPLIKDVDVLYHETTFLDTEADKAEKTMHSTAKEAALIAMKSNVKQLLLGHYSTRYANIELFKEEASTIFKNVLLAEDGKTFDFD